VKIKSNQSIVVRAGAYISAIGTAAQPILFTSANANPARGDWGTNYLYGSNNQLEYCTFKYGSNAVKVEGYPSASSGNFIKNRTFRENEQGKSLSPGSSRLSHNSPLLRKLKQRCGLTTVLSGRTGPTS